MSGAGDFIRPIKVFRASNRVSVGKTPAMGAGKYDDAGITLWCSHKVVSGSETNEKGEVAQVEAQFRTYYRTDITRADRLVYKRRRKVTNQYTVITETYEITNVVPDLDLREMVISAKQVSVQS